MTDMPSLASSGSSLTDLAGLATPGSDLTAPSSLTPGIDFASVERNMSALRAVESTWRLPALPDEVRLDLASTPGVTPEALSDLLHGTDYDLHGDSEPEPLYSPIQWNDPIERSGMDNFKVVIAGLAGNRAPEEESIDAVKAWKQRAIDMGFLAPPEDGEIDNRWDQAFNSIRYEMLNQEYDKELRGARPGAVPMSKALDTLNKWTSPSGLLGAAMDLDLFWDFGAISKEFSSWSEKWNKLGKSKNPWDFAGNLVDALTGPIDDIVVPALNLFLLTTGVGEAVNFARIGMASSKALQAGMVFDRVYEAGRLGRALEVVSTPFRSADVAADFANFGKASGLATRLQKTEGTVRAALGSGMETWRGFTPVKVAKKGVQTGMRLGLLSQAEDLLPGYQGGVALGDNNEVARIRDRFVRSPFAWGVGEALFTPYTIFQPGSLLGEAGVARTVGKGLITPLGTIGGRAAAGAVVGAVAGLAGDDGQDVALGAAIGAATGAGLPEVGRRLTAIERISPKAVGHVSDFLQATSFKPLTQDQRLTAVFDKSLRRALDPDKLKEYESAFQSGGFTAGLRQVYGIDEEAQGAALGYAFLAASIDFTATQQAKLVTGPGFEQRMHTYRDKLIAQLRGFDTSEFGDQTMEQMAWASALGSGNPWGRARRYKKTLADLQANPDKALELASGHNKLAGDTLQQLLSLENLPDLDLPQNIGQWGNLTSEARAGVLEEYLPRVWDTFANWPRFAENSTELGQLNADGLLDMARYSQVHTPAGNAVSVIPEFKRPSSTWTEDVSSNILDHLLTSRDAEWGTKGRLATFAQTIGLGKPTLARTDTLVKQDYLRWSKRLDGLVKFHDRFQSPASKTRQILRASGETAEVPERTTRGAKLIEALGDEVSGLGTFDKARLDQLALASSLSESDAKLLKDINTFVKSYNVDPADLSMSLQRLVDETLTDSDLARFGLTKFGENADGTPKALEGLDLLRSWRKDLNSKAKFKAAEIDVDTLIADLESAGRNVDADRMRTLKGQLDRDGYKLVHGVEFLTPMDLQGKTPIFDNITTRHLNSVTLGNFFKGRLPQEAHLVADRRKKLAITTALKKIGNPTGLDLDDLDGRDVEDLLLHITKVAKDAQDRASKMLDDAKNESFLHRMMARAKTSNVPVYEADLGLSVNKNLVVSQLEPLYGKPVAEAMWLAAKNFRNADFKDLGLYSFEAKLRKRSQLVDALQVFSGTGNGGTFKQAVRGAVPGAVIGAGVGMADYESDGVLQGAAAGAVAGAAAGVGINKTGLVDKAEHARYGYMADNLAKVRDQLRFTLSPWFDISRFSEAYMLNQLATPKFAANGKQIVMPLNSSPKGLIKQLTKELGSESAALERFRQSEEAFKRAAHGDFDPNVLDVTDRWFSQVGIAGFNPTKWMSTSFHHLTSQGMSAEEAYKHVRNAFTYGTRGRSAAEMSVNFIFFPFSFQKKTLSHLGKWIADDFSRSVMIHDSLKAYEMLDERYDLGERWKDYLPVMEKMQQLNAFAFGISPGRFGGINRPFVDFGKGIIQNVFTPQGVSIRNAADGEVMQDLARKMLPVYNDARHLLEDMKEQGNVAFSPTHQTTANQLRDGYKEWGEFKSEVAAALSEKGYTMAQLQRNPSLVQAKLAYQKKKQELFEKYPAWKDSMIESVYNSAALNQDKTRMLTAVATGEATITDIQFAQFDSQLQALKAQMDTLGIEEYVDLPTEQWDAIHGLAVRFSEQNPLWAGVWRAHFAKSFGPLTRKI